MLVQFVIILTISIFFLLISGNGILSFVSVLFGGLVSIINNYLIIHINKKQQKIKPNSAGVGFGLLLYSVVSRLIVVALLVFLGFKLNLLAFELVFSLVAGQIVLFFIKLK